MKLVLLQRTVGATLLPTRRVLHKKSLISSCSSPWPTSRFCKSHSPLPSLLHSAVRRNQRHLQHERVASSLFLDRMAVVTTLANETTASNLHQPWQIWNILKAAGLAMAISGFVHNDHDGTSTRTTFMESPLRQSKSPHPPNKIVYTDSVCNLYVTVLQRDGRLIYLLGTSHISRESAQLAQDLVQDVRPDAVFVELDLTRVLRLKSKLRFVNSTTTTTTSSLEDAMRVQASLWWVYLQPHRVLVPTSHVLGWKVEDESLEEQKPRLHFRNPKLRDKDFYDWSKYERVAKQQLQQQSQAPQPPVVENTELASGNEFLKAMREAVMIGAVIVLGDRDQSRTADRRAYALDESLNRRGGKYYQESEKLHLETTRASIDGSFTVNPELQKRLRDGEQLDQHVRPLFHEVLGRERNEYMAVGLDVLEQFNTIVAVVGASHLPGMEDYLQEYGWKIVPKQCPTK